VFHKQFRTGDARQVVLEKPENNRGQDASPPSKLASSILSTTLVGTFWINGDWLLNILELFREETGDMAEKHNEFFLKFDESMLPNAKRIDVAQRKKQIRFGLRIANIIDELHMLQQLFETQRDVLLKTGQDIYNV
jgi:hypothetical protein